LAPADVDDECDLGVDVRDALSVTWSVRAGAGVGSLLSLNGEGSLGEAHVGDSASLMGSRPW